MSTRGQVARTLGHAVAAGLRSALRSSARNGRHAPAGAGRRTTAGSAYPGDFSGRSTVEYAPRPDGEPDPGEVVWGWVPFEEDHARGKDRPALVVGRDGRWLLALMLSSRDHDRTAADRAEEQRRGRSWLDVGTGGWDAQRRPSEVRVDRVIRLDPAAVRREGATLDRTRFDAVAAALRSEHGWG